MAKKEQIIVGDYVCIIARVCSDHNTLSQQCMHRNESHEWSHPVMATAVPPDCDDIIISKFDAYEINMKLGWNAHDRHKNVYSISLVRLATPDEIVKHRLKKTLNEQA